MNAEPLNQERSAISDTDPCPGGDRSQNAVSVKELPQFFIGRGEVRNFIFQQIARTDVAYLFQVTPPGCRSHFEIFYRRVNGRFWAVSYPRAEAFGVWALTARTLTDAEARFHSLNTAQP